MRPMFKPVFYVRQMPGHRLRIGETLPNRAFEVEDEDDIVIRLIEWMDGTRTIEELACLLKQEGLKLSKSELVELLHELDEYGCLDDASAVQSAGLNDEELERFKANLHYLSYSSKITNSPYHMQKRLKDARITVIGIGSLGAGVLFNLAGLGVSTVRIVDFDTVERSNLNRQMLYKERDIGRRKVDAAVDFMRDFYSAMKVEALDVRIGSAADARCVIAGSDLVVLAADQPHIQLERWVNWACMELRIPWIGGGLMANEGMFYTVIPGQTGCIECNHIVQNAADETRLSFLEDFLASGFRMPSAAIAAHYMLLIGAVSSEIARWITGFAPLQSAGKVIALDFHTYASHVKMDFSVSSPSCPICSSNNQAVRKA